MLGFEIKTATAAAKAKAKYRDLSTPLRLAALAQGSVEMTCFEGGVGKTNANANAGVLRCAQNDDLRLSQNDDLTLKMTI